ncbi:DUF6273 domain-containing protein [Flavonifractor plautii]|uniref:DUF6273 domain-containing protein n=1 Tax=Flavonifractor plautii TaxID=292800 RepID=UPI001D05F4F2|nr:DUF6273 domain-containing protein [Flavonifractor plautii]
MGKRDFCRASPDGTACYWWLRSVNATNSNNFCNVNTDGSANNNNANWSNGFAPGFKDRLGPEQVAKCEAAPQNLKEDLTLGDWPRRRGFNPKLTTRYGGPDASCMAGDFDGSAPVT